MAKRDYYDILGVERGCSEGDLKKAFRKAAMAHHPDRNRHDPKSEARFKEVNEAYDVLKDANKKAAYDRFGHAAFENGHGASAGAGFRPAPVRPTSPPPSLTSSTIFSATSWAAAAARGRGVSAPRGAPTCATTSA